LLLDLSGVAFFAAQSISVLISVDDACRSAELPWALVPSHAVDRVLRISQDDDILPVASSVPDAMQYFVTSRACAEGSRYQRDSQAPAG
jgi:hypothetical protein